MFMNGKGSRNRSSSLKYWSNYDRIFRLRREPSWLAKLRTVLGEEEYGKWLKRPSKQFEGKSPNEMIEHGDISLV